MKFNSLEDLVNFIKNDIMKDDYERVLSFNFGEKEILVMVFENEIPIRVTYHKVYKEDGSVANEIFAEVCAELLRQDIGKGWLRELDDICSVLDDNQDIFKKLLKGESND